MTTNVLNLMMQTAVDDYELLVSKQYDNASWEGSVAVNAYIDKYHGLFLGFGQWTRMVYVKFADPTAKPHQTILGAMGIISMNVENIRAKINFARMM